MEDKINDSLKDKDIPVDVQEEGIYLCEVEGLMHNKFMILFREQVIDDWFWEEYFIGGMQEGWCGLHENINVTKVLQKLN